MRTVLLLLLLFSIPANALEKGTSTGLPVPRFVTLKSSDINARTGPGTNYPIKWQYTRKGLPVEIVAEFEQWRKIRDHDGEEGWVHQNMVSGKRGIITVEEIAVYDDENLKIPTLRLAKGAIAELVSCGRATCQLKINHDKVYIPRENLWGVYKDEIISK